MKTKARKRSLLRTAVPVGIVLLVVLSGLALRSGLWNTAPTDPEEPSEASTAVHTEPSVTLPPPTASVYTYTDFGYVDGYLTCLSGPCVRGVDVSSWQQNVDWPQVKAAGMDFAMLRLGYRGTEQGGLFPDDYAQTNYQQASAAGLSVGGYFFSQAITPAEARQEAEYVLELIKGWDVKMPIVYDWEYVDEDARTADVDARTLTDCTIAFCETIKDAGYEPMIYFNPELERKQMFLEELTDYKFWLALYSDEMTYPYRVDMWQYTSQGSVPGIEGAADINLLFLYE